MSDPDELPVLQDITGLLTTEQKAAELGIKTRALMLRKAAGKTTPVGKQPGGLYWEPEDDS